MSLQGISVSKVNNKVTIENNLPKYNKRCHLSDNLNEYVSEIYDNKNKVLNFIYIYHNGMWKLQIYGSISVALIIQIIRNNKVEYFYWDISKSINDLTIEHFDVMSLLMRSNLPYLKYFNFLNFDINQWNIKCQNELSIVERDQSREVYEETRIKYGRALNSFYLSFQENTNIMEVNIPLYMNELTDENKKKISTIFNKPNYKNLEFYNGVNTNNPFDYGEYTFNNNIYYDVQDTLKSIIRENQYVNYLDIYRLVTTMENNIELIDITNTLVRPENNPLRIVYSDYFMNQIIVNNNNNNDVVVVPDVNNNNNNNNVVVPVVNNNNNDVTNTNGNENDDLDGYETDTYISGSSNTNGDDTDVEDNEDVKQPSKRRRRN